jgi:hypothetical protein
MWGITKKYKSLNWFENHMGGHISIGGITIYGENAMHWGVNIRSKKYGYICFRLPFRCFGKWWPLYFYVSPNGTPWASTFYMGKDKSQKKKSQLRKEAFGHNFKYEYEDETWNKLMQINNSLIIKEV